MKVGAVILAAGGSSRTGVIKQLLPLGGKPLLQHVIDTAGLVDFEKVVVVLGAGFDEINRSISLPDNAEVIRNLDWQRGQGTSIRLGMSKLGADYDAVLFLLGDQPFVSAELIEKELRTFGETKPDIIAPRYKGHRGNPVLFSQKCFEELSRLEGDGGGKQLFSWHEVIEVDWLMEIENLDIDTMEDYERALLINNAHSHLCTIILSAGLSTRMKQPKLLMPWGATTVLGAVISAFRNSGVGDIRVVTGGFRGLIEEESSNHNALSIFNPKFTNGEMLDSMKSGLESLSDTTYEAAFVALGDQPAVSSEDIIQMEKVFFDTQAPLIIPSFAMRRGHPWLVSRKLWDEILKMKSPSTMRDFIEKNKDQIIYYLVKSSRILQDLDTPEDYEKCKPR